MSPLPPLPVVARALGRVLARACGVPQARADHPQLGRSEGLRGPRRLRGVGGRKGALRWPGARLVPADFLREGEEGLRVVGGLPGGTRPPRGVRPPPRRPPRQVRPLRVPALHGVELRAPSRIVPAAEGVRRGLDPHPPRGLRASRWERRRKPDCGPLLGDEPHKTPLHSPALQTTCRAPSQGREAADRAAPPLEAFFHDSERFPDNRPPWPAGPREVPDSAAEARGSAPDSGQTVTHLRPTGGRFRTPGRGLLEAVGGTGAGPPEVPAAFGAVRRARNDRQTPRAGPRKARVNRRGPGSRGRGMPARPPETPAEWGWAFGRSVPARGLRRRLLRGLRTSGGSSLPGGHPSIRTVVGSTRPEPDRAPPRGMRPRGMEGLQRVGGGSPGVLLPKGGTLPPTRGPLTPLERGRRGLPGQSRAAPALLSERGTRDTRHTIL